MHDVDAQSRVANERFLQCQGAVQCRTISAETEVRGARRTGPDMNADGYVELRGDQEMRFEARIAGFDPDVLIGDFRENRETAIFIEVTQRFR